MAENTDIEWADHTFNAWIGCTNVSAACDNCYAEAFSNRFTAGAEWGPHGERRKTSAANWKKPLAWDRKASAAGIRYRVFLNSLSDTFDNHKTIADGTRDDLWALIEATPNLDWLILTKRPQNIDRFAPYDDIWPDNVWLGTTVENQTTAAQRVPHLLKHNAKVRFLSCEPLLGSLSLDNMLCGGSRLNAFTGQHPRLKPTPSAIGINWVIAGGESGGAFRETKPIWFQTLRNQCRDYGVPFLFKQWSGANQKVIKRKGRILDGVFHNAYPTQQRPAHSETNAGSEIIPIEGTINEEKT